MSSSLIPVVSPLDPATGKLTTDVGVDIAITRADFDVRDTTLVKWGIYGKMLAPAATGRNPAQHLAVPAKHICNGYATAWFSVQDAIGNLSYSTGIKIFIDMGAGKGVANPTIIAVDPADPSVGMQVEIFDDPNYELVLEPADEVVVGWDIYQPDGELVKSFTKTITLPSATGGSFTTPPLVPVPTGKQYMLVQYALTRTRLPEQSATGQSSPPSEQQFQSLLIKKFAQELWPDGSEALPAPIFTDAVDGVLYIDAVPGDVQLAIPSSPYIMNSSVTFVGSGKDQYGRPVAAAAWAPSSVVVATTPYSGTPVPRDLVRAVGDDGTYAVSYSTQGYSSFGNSVAVKLKNLNPQTASTGELWGWGDPQYGTLG